MQYIKIKVAEALSIIDFNIQSLKHNLVKLKELVCFDQKNN